MAQITNHIENFKMNINEDFIRKAQELEPVLRYKTVRPAQLVSSQSSDVPNKPNGWDLPVHGRVDRVFDWIPCRMQPVGALDTMPLSKGSSACLDFGTHHVGYISSRLTPAGSPPDVPVHIRIRLEEMPCEVMEDTASYRGSISSSQIQGEYLHIGELLARVSLPRRYAFRCLELKVMDTPPKYQVLLSDVSCDTVTSGDMSQVDPLNENAPEDLKRIDTIALKIMEDCMQSVLEDGPKHDRRLWIGDLRLQALTNYEIFKNYDPVKRCLYLFAGLTQNEHHIGACLFLWPAPMVDDTSLFDYGLSFISCLHDYYRTTGDRETLMQLWSAAYHQAGLAPKRLDGRGVVKGSGDWWCFLDWNDSLNKQAGAQGVLIYTLRQVLSLARLMCNETSGVESAEQLESWIETAVRGALEYLWDKELRFFISGQNRQVFWASQIWLVLVGVLDQESNHKLPEHLVKEDPPVGMVTPYMYHHLIEALIQSGVKDIALHYIRFYWGQMTDLGAGCFWELSNPRDRYASPYGSRIINSYCHAWSYIPSYFIREYFN